MPPKKAAAARKKRGKTTVAASSSSAAKQTKRKSAKNDAAGSAKVAKIEGSGDTGHTKSLKLESYLEDPKWKEALASEFEADYFKKLENSLQKEYDAGKTIFPPRDLIFNAYNLTPLPDVKVVIIGQDPYHDDRQAHGLSFSVPHGVTPPPSLKNIYKELEGDIVGFHPPLHGCLISWTEEGVFLLNAALTVEAHKANSHAKLGWSKFTDATIKLISDQRRHVIFILWGKFAQDKDKLIDETKHYIIKAAHPSPLSYSKFKGCKCFSQANNALKNYGKEPVDWTLEHELD